MPTEEQSIMLQAKFIEDEKLVQARAMSDAERFFSGAELFEDACQRTLAGIRYDFPGISDEDALQKLRELIESDQVPQ